MRSVIVTALGVSLLCSTALAEKKRDQSADMGDSSRIICETVKLTGSRLARKKTCHTAAEWAEIRRQQRMVTDKIQAYKPAFVQ